MSNHIQYSQPSSADSTAYSTGNHWDIPQTKFEISSSGEYYPETPLPQLHTSAKLEGSRHRTTYSTGSLTDSALGRSASPRSVASTPATAGPTSAPAEVWNLPSHMTTPNSMLSSDTILVIISEIINPILSDQQFQYFNQSCQQAASYLQSNLCRSLRDLEKHLFDQSEKTLPNDPLQRSVLQKRIMALVRNCFRQISSDELCRPGDEAYHPGYFLNKEERINQILKTVSPTRQTRRSNSTKSLSGTQRQDSGTHILTSGGSFVQSPQSQMMSVIKVEPSRQGTKWANSPSDIQSGNPGSFGSPLTSHVAWSPNSPFTTSKLENYDFQNSGYPTYPSESYGTSGMAATPVSATSYTLPVDQYATEYGYATQTQPVVHPTESFYTHSQESLPVLDTSRLVSEGEADEEDVSDYGAKSPKKSSKASKKGARTPVDLVDLICDNLDEKKGGPCGKTFTRRCDLRKHIFTHTRPHKCTFPGCEYAEKGFPTETEKIRHINDKHAPDPQLYKCQWAKCDYSSRREANCKAHMEATHGWRYVKSKRPKGIVGKGPRSSTFTRGSTLQKEVRSEMKAAARLQRKSLPTVSPAQDLQAQSVPRVIVQPADSSYSSMLDFSSTSSASRERNLMSTPIDHLQVFSNPWAHENSQDDSTFKSDSSVPDTEDDARFFHSPVSPLSVYAHAIKCPIDPTLPMLELENLQRVPESHPNIETYDWLLNELL